MRHDGRNSCYMKIGNGIVLSGKFGFSIIEQEINYFIWKIT